MRTAKMWGTALAMLLAAAPGIGQVRQVDPNQAIDGDLPAQQRSAPAPSARPAPAPADADVQGAADSDRPAPTDEPQRPAAYPGEPGQERRADRTEAADQTFHRDDLIGAGEGVFGKGAKGLAQIIEKILKDQGEPNAYIAGREASGAFVVGVRYGSGVMTHKVEGQQNVYWTGPSAGFDVGGDANKVFVLVYNLYDTADLFKVFPHGEGHLYFVGGFSASYLRRGHIVLIPVRLGVGVRAGVNVGYMHFTRKSKWVPF
jgi:hypothetical protein